MVSNKFFEIFTSDFKLKVPTTTVCPCENFHAGDLVETHQVDLPPGGTF